MADGGYPRLYKQDKLVQNFADIGQSVNELWPKSDFQDGGRRHLEF